jgi:hypothetical protein
MQRIVCIATTALLVSSSAIATTKQTVRTKLRELRIDLQDTDANSRELTDVLELLNEAQDILVTGSASPVDFTDCYNYLYPLYDRSYSSSQASSKASSACRSIYDMDVLEYAVEKFDRSLSTGNAVDKAVTYNTRDIRGKFPIVEFAYEKYDRGYSNMNAIERALKGAATVKKDALACLQMIFPKHDRTTSSTNAMDKTFRDCQ